MSDQATRARIVARILARRRQGRPLNYKARVRGGDEAVVRAAVGCFGSWDAALRAAGFDSAAIRLRHPWSRRRLLEAIARRVRDGKPLNAAAVFREEGELYQTACLRFGSWDRALRAAGHDPARIRLKAPRGHPSRDEIVAAIRRRRRAGEPLGYSGMPHSLRRGADRRFGSWRAALEAAGVDPESAGCRPRPWTRKEVLALLRKRRDSGASLRRSDLLSWSSRFVDAAVRHFGSWLEALEAADVPCERANRWNRRRVVREIRRLRAAGRPLNSYAVQKHSRRLWHAAWFHLGSWDAALRAAGLDPALIRKKSPRRGA